ncbi:MAG: proline dehydrogenase family protein [Bacteroidales bacterium]|nr:proline dehydrogenase family protein [Bacteroidales bacterium]
MINRLIANIIPLLPEQFVWIFSKKYIAGNTFDDAAKIASEFNKVGIYTTIDILGELLNNKEQALEYQQAYFEAISSSSKIGLQTTFSLKPSMFGLLQDFDFCYSTIHSIIQKAAEYNFFVRIDMEDSGCTDRELELFTKLYKEFPGNVGIVIQSYLKRSIEDVSNLIKISQSDFPVNVRLCKGIYIESARIAYRKRKEINTSFINILEMILKNKLFAAIATHDKILVSDAIRLLEKYNFPKGSYEFQMLYGVAHKLRDQLVGSGRPMRIYVPYGEKWFNYSTRRLQENPRMVREIIKALLINN